MQAFFDWLIDLFGWGNLYDEELYSKIGTYFTLYAILLIVFAIIMVALIITVVILAVQNSKNKKKAKDLENRSGEQDSGELRNRIRTEIEPIIRREIEKEYEDKIPKSGVTDEQFTRLKAKLDEKDNQIKELGRALEQANAATHAISANSNSNELHKTISDLTLQNSLLTDQNKQLHDEISDLQAEILKLKDQQGKQKVAAEKAKQKAVEKATKEEQEKAAKEQAEKEAREKAAKEKAEQEEQPKPKSVKKKAQPKSAEPVEDDDDEGMIDNEYGGEDSEIKVTLSYDKMKMDWVIHRSDSERTIRRLPTKHEALPIAKELAKKLGAQLIVLKMDGNFQYN